MTAHRAQNGAIEQRLGGQWRRSLDDLLTRQLALYGELDALCQRQRGLIEQGDAERLLGLLGERDRIVEELRQTGERFRAFAEVWHGIESALGAEAAEDIRRRLASITSLAESIAAHDGADHASIVARRDELADRLAGLGRKSRAVNAYSGARPSGPRFQDREG